METIAADVLISRPGTAFRLGAAGPGRDRRHPGQGQDPAAQGEAMTGLATALRARVRGGVRFDPGSRALYATDASNYRQVPNGVGVAKTLRDGVPPLAG